MKRIHFTATEQVIMDILGDGQPHRPEELMSSVDELNTFGNVRVHMHNIKKKLAVNNQTIICQTFGNWRAYRWVQLLSKEDQS